MRTFNYHMLARISVKPWDSLKSAITHTQTSKGGGLPEWLLTP